MHFRRPAGTLSWRWEYFWIKFSRDSTIPYLSITAKGNATIENAGIVGAIASLASKLETQSGQPVILFENDRKSCIIQQHGDITGAIYKSM